MKFKTLRQEEEYKKSLTDKSRGIVDVLIYADEYSKKNFGKEVVVTEIYRTQEEQDAIYRNSADYHRKPWQSVHQFWRGADLRVWEYTTEQVLSLCDAINARFIYDKSRPDKKTCLVHDVGAGLHFHLQVAG